MSTLVVCCGSDRACAYNSCAFEAREERVGQAPDYVDACGMCLWQALHWNVPHLCLRSLSAIVHVIVS